jgi:hypothetical protein
VHARADRQHDGVVALAQLGGGEAGADVDPVLEPHALGLEQPDPAVDVPLLELEVGHAEAQQAAGALVAFVDHDLVPGAVQVRRGGQAGRPGADHADAAPAARLRRVRDDPALLPGALDDRQLDLLDRDRVVVDGQDAGRLARRGADQARPLGEVVRRVQLLDRLAPAVLVDEVVPIRDQVAERAAVVAERDAALHAARALARRLVVGQDLVDLVVVRHALARIALRRGRARDLQESAELSHGTGKRTSPLHLERQAAERDDRSGHERGHAHREPADVLRRPSPPLQAVAEASRLRVLYAYAPRGAG